MFFGCMSIPYKYVSYICLLENVAGINSYHVFCCNAGPYENRMNCITNRTKGFYDVKQTLVGIDGSSKSYQNVEWMKI